MQRNTVGFALIALFTIAVIGISASSIHSTPIQSGFGIKLSGPEHLPNGSMSSGGGDGGGGSGGGFDSGGFDVANPSSISSGSVSPLIVPIALTTIAAVGVALIFWATRDDTDPRAGSVPSATETTDTNESHPEPSEPVELTNKVYRAWWEMACQTQISRTVSQSPSEIAAAAVDAGMKPDAVAELTHLFRGVRYGGMSATNDVEQRATAALNQIRSQPDDLDQETNP